MFKATVLKPQFYEGSDEIKLTVKPHDGFETEAVSTWKKDVVIMTADEYALQGSSLEADPMYPLFKEFLKLASRCVPPVNAKEEKKKVEIEQLEIFGTPVADLPNTFTEEA